MSGRAGTWSDRAIAAGCTAVIIAGAFAISGHSSAHGGKPKVHPAPIGVPVPSGTRHATAKPSHPAKPSPTSTSTGQAAAPSAAPSGAASTSSKPTAPAATPTAAKTSSSSSTPIPPGVLGAFSYATTGYETTTIPGTKRSFPATTTITNTKQGCGVESTWKPSSDHVQSQLLCPSGSALKIASYKTKISFFGISSGENFKCSGDSFIYQPGVAAGHVWKYKCTSPDAVASQQAHVLGYSRMSVGGTSVRVLHVRVETTLTGSDSGKTTQEYWIATKKPVLVKESGTVTATQQGVHYTEAYSLTLKSLSPKT
ncbi:MAG TPA: hypothetical protein VHV76_02045 [Mycobacteriales bacterium]|nr:hypothetical protein [Mycobacteriales bacterium]